MQLFSHSPPPRKIAGIIQKKTNLRFGQTLASRICAGNPEIRRYKCAEIYDIWLTGRSKSLLFSFLQALQSRRYKTVSEQKYLLHAPGKAG